LKELKVTSKTEAVELAAKGAVLLYAVDKLLVAKPAPLLETLSKREET
jgi:hypothetical protein